MPATKVSVSVLLGLLLLIGVSGGAQEDPTPPEALVAKEDRRLRADRLSVQPGRDHSVHGQQSAAAIIRPTSSG